MTGAVIAISSPLAWVTGAAVQEDGPDSETSVSNTIAAEQDAQVDRGEPIAPAMEGPQPTPEPAATPGDAPAGDPVNDAQ